MVEPKPQGMPRRDFLKNVAKAGAGVAASVVAGPVVDTLLGKTNKVEAAGPGKDIGVEVLPAHRNRFKPDFRYSMFRPDKNQDGISFGFFESDRLQSPMPIPEKTGMSALVEWDTTTNQYKPKADIDPEIKTDLMNTPQADVRRIGADCDLLVLQEGQLTGFSGGYSESDQKRRLVVTKKGAGEQWKVTDSYDWNNLPGLAEKGLQPTALYAGYYEFDQNGAGTAVLGISAGPKPKEEGKFATSQEVIAYRIDAESGKVIPAFSTDKYEIFEMAETVDRQGNLLVKARTLKDGKGWSKKVWDAKWYDAKGNVVGERAPSHAFVVDKNNQPTEIPQTTQEGFLEEINVGPDNGLWMMRRDPQDTKGAVKVLRADTGTPLNEKVVMTVNPAGTPFAYAAETGLYFSQDEKDSSLLPVFVGVYDGGVDPYDQNAGSVKKAFDIAVGKVDAAGNPVGNPVTGHVSSKDIEDRWIKPVVEGESRDGGKRKAVSIRVARYVPEYDPPYIKLAAETPNDGTYLDIFPLNPKQ